MAFIPGTTIEQPTPISAFGPSPATATGLASGGASSPQPDQNAQTAANLQKQLSDIAAALAALPPTQLSTPTTGAKVDEKTASLIASARNLTPQDQTKFIQSIAITDPQLAQQVSSGLGIAP